ncbi:MAG: helicase C-terminal domain-containing protein [Candidatus Didemnitutus sp.]|nr:helicase C-terminal domain-containing protein [Candidatus Didemnitutus sp.]
MISLNEGDGPAVSHTTELTATTFAAAGWLVHTLGLEHRAEQERMGHAVAAAFATDSSLLCEAGTGVGKSLAYLVPGIIHAVDTRRQFVVSTHTKTLQEQIRDKDLANCRRLFGAVPEFAAYRDFTSAVLMGKGNYLCTTRLKRALAEKRDLFQSAEQVDLKRVALWAATTETGLLIDLAPRVSAEVWDEVSADSDACSARNCQDGSCFYRRAKALCESANLLIVNHSLLFTLMVVNDVLEKSPASGILRLQDFVVLDEAHTVPEIATEQLGLSLSSGGLRRVLVSLFNPAKTKGLFVKHDDAEASRVVEIALEQSAHFFAQLAERASKNKGPLRVREPGFAENLLSGPLNSVLARLDQLRTRLPDGVAQDGVTGKQRRVSAYRDNLTAWLNQSREGSVYWLETGTARRELAVQLRSAPLDVSAELRERLFSRHTSAVLTSATLASGSTMEPFRDRVGANGVEILIEKSPFDFERHMRVFLAADMPEPSGAESRLNLDVLTDYVRFCTLAVPGGSLVLFTSYRDLQEVAQRLEKDYREAGRVCLTQTAGVSRSDLAERLRQAGTGVLFGTESFWTGIDVPGASLSQVIITRLPFEPPNHPVAQARAEWITSEGGNPFSQLALPEALGKFRQGIGRLIRNKTDCGVVTILDPRVLTKAYGREFIACLPTQNLERMTRDNRADVFRPFI